MYTLQKILPIICLVCCCRCLGQTDSAAHKKTDTATPRTANGGDTLRRAQPARAGAGDSSTPSTRDSGSVRKKDSIALVAPLAAVKTDTTAWYEDTAFIKMLTFTPIAPGVATTLNSGQPRQPNGKEQLFYILAGLFVFVGLAKVAYPKYFQDIFKLFIQTSRRQKQTPEQIVQGYLPGFLFNLLFFATGGLLITLYGMHINAVTVPVWLSVLYCAGLLAGIYLVKYTVTALAGLVFNVKDAASTYTFIIFLINRVIGLVSLPLAALIAFYSGAAINVLFTIAAGLVLLLLVYRYAVSLTVIRKNLKVSALHFFIYLCAVELMPMLVIYKVLFSMGYGK